MILHLENKEKQIILNLNFTKFFGCKYSLYQPYLERRQNQKLLIKYLIEYFAPNEEKGVQMVKNWFEQALDEMKGEDTIDGQISVLNESYGYFLKNYKLNNNQSTNFPIKKINSYKGKKGTPLLKVKLKDYLCVLVTPSFSYYHYGDTYGIVEFIPQNTIEGYRNILENRYSNILNNFTPIKTLKLSELRIFDFLEIKNRDYPLNGYFKYFNSKDYIEISSFEETYSNVEIKSAVLKQKNNLLIINGYVSQLTEDNNFTILTVK